MTTSTVVSRHDVGGSFCTEPSAVSCQGSFFQRAPLVMKRRRGSLLWVWRSAWKLHEPDWSFFRPPSHVKPRTMDIPGAALGQERGLAGWTFLTRGATLEVRRLAKAQPRWERPPTWDVREARLGAWGVKLAVPQPCPKTRPLSHTGWTSGGGETGTEIPPTWGLMAEPDRKSVV